MSTLPSSRHATLPLLLAATLLVAACSDDDPSVVPSPEEAGGAVPPDDGVGEPGGGDPQAGEPAEGEPGEGEPGDGGVGEPVDGGEPAGGTEDALVPEIPPGREDRPGLIVRFPGDREPGALSSPWLAIVSAFQVAPVPERSGDLRVDLSRYEDGLDFSSAIDFYTPELETCDIRTLDDPGTDGGNEQEDGADGVDSVSGGDTVTLSSAGGKWLSAPFSSGSMVYEVDNAFPGPAPDDLTLSVPGDVFPGIEALPIVVPTVPERLSPAVDEAVIDGTEYRWMPADDDAFVQIVFKQFVDGAFVRFPVVCDVLDDGAFELPDDAAAALAALPGTTTVRYARMYNRLDFRDGIAAFQTFLLADD